MDIKDRVIQLIEYKGISVNAFEKSINASKSYIKNVKDVSAIVVANIIREYSDVNPEWLLTGEGPMLRDLLHADSAPRTGIPLYRIEAAAGFGTAEFNIEESDIEARYKIRELSSASFMIHVRGDSMSPTYNNGDIIAVQVIKDKRNIQWGKPHLVSSSVDGLLVKRIYDDDGDIIAVSDNPSYKPLHIKKDDITGVAAVRGVVKFESF